MIKRSLNRDLANVKADIIESGSYSEYFNIYELKDVYSLGYHTVTIRGSEDLRKGTYIYVEILDEGGRPIPIEVLSADSIFEQTFLPLRRFKFEVTEETLNGVADMYFVGTRNDGKTIKYHRKVAINKTIPSTPIVYRGQWREGVYYNVNNVVIHNGSSYIATVGHESASDTEPDVGSNWEQNWDPFARARDGEDGFGAVVSIESSNGMFFEDSDVTTTLEATLLINGQPVSADNYKWYKNGDLVTGVSSNTLQVNEIIENSIYTVEVYYDGNVYIGRIQLTGYKSAKYLQLKISGNSFTTGTNGDISPNKLTFEAIRIDNNYPISWEYIDSDGNVNVIGENTDGFNYIGQTEIEILPSLFETTDRFFTIRAYTGVEGVEDQEDVYMLRPDDSVTVEITNPTHDLRSDWLGNVYSSSFTNYEAYLRVVHGIELLEYNDNASSFSDLSNGEYYITSITDRPDSTLDTTTEFSVIKDSSQEGYTNSVKFGISSFNPEVDEASINFTIVVKLKDGTQRTFIRSLGFSKAKDAEPQRYVQIEPINGTIFKKDKFGNVLPNELRFQLFRKDLQDDCNWSIGSKNETTQASDTPEEFIVYPSDVENETNDVETILAQINETNEDDSTSVFTDRLSVAILEEGGDGLTVLTDPSIITIPTDAEGAPYGSINETVTIVVYFGSLDITQNFNWSLDGATNNNYATISDDTITITGIDSDIERVVFRGVPKTEAMYQTEFGNTDNFIADLPEITKSVTLYKTLQGFQGLRGLSLVFKGVYESNESYEITENSTDVVVIDEGGNDVYYYLDPNLGEGSSTRDTPSPTSNDWIRFEAQFKSIATDLLLTKNVTVRRFLTLGDASEEGNVYGAQGAIRSLGGIDIANYDDEDINDLTSLTNAGLVTYDQNAIDTNPDIERFFEISPYGIFAWRGKIGGWTMTPNELFNYDSDGGLRLRSKNKDITPAEPSIDFMKDNNSWNFRMSPNAELPATVDLITSSSANWSSGDSFGNGLTSGTYTSNSVNISGWDRSISILGEYSITNNSASYGTLKIQGLSGSWQTIEERNINFGSSTETKNYEFFKNLSSYSQVRIFVEITDGDVDVSGLTLKQYEQITVFNKKGIFTRTSPDHAHQVTGYQSNFVDIGGGGGSWDSILGKPFEDFDTTTYFNVDSETGIVTIKDSILYDDWTFSVDQTRTSRGVSSNQILSGYGITLKEGNNINFERDNNDITNPIITINSEQRSYSGTGAISVDNVENEISWDPTNIDTFLKSISLRDPADIINGAELGSVNLHDNGVMWFVGTDGVTVDNNPIDSQGAVEITLDQTYLDDLYGYTGSDGIDIDGSNNITIDQTWLSGFTYDKWTLNIDYVTTPATDESIQMGSESQITFKEGSNVTFQYDSTGRVITVNANVGLQEGNGIDIIGNVISVDLSEIETGFAETISVNNMGVVPAVNGGQLHVRNGTGINISSLSMTNPVNGYYLNIAVDETWLDEQMPTVNNSEILFSDTASILVTQSDKSFTLNQSDTSQTFSFDISTDYLSGLADGSTIGWNSTLNEYYVDTSTIASRNWVTNNFSTSDFIGIYFAVEGDTAGGTLISNEQYIDFRGGSNITISKPDSGSSNDNIITISATVTDTNYYLSDLSFNTGNGILTATVSGADNQSVDLDGRYAFSSHNHSAGDINSGTLSKNRLPNITTSEVDFANQNLNTNSSPTFSRLKTTPSNFFGSWDIITGSGIWIGGGADLEIDGGISYASDHRYNSDIRLKKILGKGSGLEFAKHAYLYKFILRDQERPTWGLIAQDMEKADPYLVQERPDDEFGSILTLSGGVIASLALDGVRELNEKFESETYRLRKRIKQLEKKVEELENGITK